MVVGSSWFEEVEGSGSINSLENLKNSNQTSRLFVAPMGEEQAEDDDEDTTLITRSSTKKGRDDMR